MIFKKIHEHFKNSFIFEKDNDFLNLFTRFKESTPIGKSNDELVDNDRIGNVLNWAKSQGYLDELEISEENTETLLRSFLIERDLPEELVRNKRLRNELTQVIEKRAAENAPVRVDEAKQAIELISTGEVFRDVSYSIAVIIALVVKPERFSEPEENLKGLIEGLVKLPSSLASDLDPRAIADRFSLQIQQVQSGQPIQAPEILNSTLAGIYALPEVGDIIDTANALLDNENASLRLALVIYARLNGINLEQQDIDKVRATVLNRENPDLGALLLYLADRENLSRLVL